MRPLNYFFALLWPLNNALLQPNPSKKKCHTEGLTSNLAISIYEIRGKIDQDIKRNVLKGVTDEIASLFHQSPMKVKKNVKKKNVKKFSCHSVNTNG